MSTMTASWRRSMLGALAIVPLMTFGASAAQAYAYTTCSGVPVKWQRGWTNLSINTVSLPPGSVWDIRFQNAMARWNNVKGSGFNFYFLRDTDGTYSNTNGVTEIYFARNLGTALAVTFFRWQCSSRNIIETDIGFNLNYSWTTSPLSYDSLGSPYSFESVALHELGHSLGLNHEDRWLATLNSFYPNSGPVGYGKEWDPLADDRAGARFLYPDGTTEVDLAASDFKRTGAGTSGLTSSSLAAVRGATAVMEQTFHNFSTSRRTFNIGFYLSTNDIISTGDRLLGTNTGAWADPGVSVTFSRTLAIPGNVSPGRYWLGFILDRDAQHAEDREGNNALAMPRPITIN
ncbi:matrixin family metalloprotease [Geminicoccus roseus]|uniref:matrixin family metalloprotease n=1 Tax=Geminicoccus roseus TaxID=404900 RepID=UPI00042271A9|nr:matrixin family metalloprotease [Geminicoccus roseus]